MRGEIKEKERKKERRMKGTLDRYRRREDEIQIKEN